MDTYEKVSVYDAKSKVIGYGILKIGTTKLTTRDLFDATEAVKCTEQINNLNESILLSPHWPKPNDPDVVKLTNDPTFEPTPPADGAGSGWSYKRLQKASRVIARQRAGLARQQAQA